MIRMVCDTFRKIENEKLVSFLFPISFSTIEPCPTKQDEYSFCSLVNKLKRLTYIILSYRYKVNRFKEKLILSL